ALIMMKRREAPKSAAPTPAPTPTYAPKAEATPWAPPKAAPPPDENEINSKRVRNHRIVATLVAFVGYFVIATRFGLEPEFIGRMTWFVMVPLLIVVYGSGLIFGRKTEKQKVRQAWVGAITWMLLWTGLGIWVVKIDAERKEKDAATAKQLAEA